MSTKKVKELTKDVIQTIQTNINNKYKNTPRYELLYDDGQCEFLLQNLLYINKENKVKFIDEVINIHPTMTFLEYVHNVLKNNLPEIKQLTESNMNKLKSDFFVEYDMNHLDWNSLNPKSGYYLCYYRKIGNNKWVYNFSIFEYDNDYGYWTELKNNRSYKRENIMGFLFLES